MCVPVHICIFVITQLDALYGTWNATSSMKTNYNLPQPLLSNSDLTKLLNSDEIQVRKYTFTNYIISTSAELRFDFRNRKWTVHTDQNWNTEDLISLDFGIQN